MPHRDKIDDLVFENQEWSTEAIAVDAEFFARHVNGQRPDALWIGCVDSRVTPSTVTGAKIGALLVHRNVANQVVTDDDETLATIEFAVSVLNVPHIVVCGHTKCGGVTAGCKPDLGGIAHMPALRRWVRPIQADYLANRVEIDGASDPVTALTRITVRTQIARLASLPVITERWAQGEGPVLHGLLYHIEDGRIERLIRRTRTGIETD